MGRGSRPNRAGLSEWDGKGERKRKVGSGGGTDCEGQKKGREEDLYAAEKKVPRLSVVCPALLPAAVLRFRGKRRRRDAATNAAH